MQRARLSFDNNIAQKAIMPIWAFAAFDNTERRLCHVVIESGSLYERAHQFHRVRRET